MKKILEDYEETITVIEKRIERLKAEKLKERELKKLHDLERRIELLREERLDMIKICREIREYLAPKEDLPEYTYRMASGDN